MQYSGLRLVLGGVVDRNIGTKTARTSKSGSETMITRRKKCHKEKVEIASIKGFQ